MLSGLIALLGGYRPYTAGFYIYIYVYMYILVKYLSPYFLIYSTDFGSFTSV